MHLKSDNVTLIRLSEIKYVVPYMEVFVKTNVVE